MMSPETLPIDRRFKGVGRLKRASGTLVPAVLKQINRMLTALGGGGQLGGLPILRALRDRELSFLEVLDAYQRQTLDELPTGTAARRLIPAMKAWADSLRVPEDVSREHKAMMGTARRHIEAERPEARIADLPAVVESLRDTLGRPHPTAFNNLRAIALAFVRDTLKRNHPLWLAVSAVERRVVKHRKAHRPLRLDEMRARFPAPETDPVDAIAWTMATTGMGQKELWGRWAVKSDRIHVSGTKRGGRDRDVPLVRVPSVPTMHRRTFENKLRERDRGFTPYNLRRTYANWMEDAGIPRTRRRAYLGHGAADVSDLYERREVDAYLAEDAERLRALLGVTAPKVVTLVRKGGAR